MIEGKMKCIYCERSSDEAPIIAFQFRGEIYGICPQHLPVMIHKPSQMAGKLPGMEAVDAAEGHDH